LVYRSTPLKRYPVEAPAASGGDYSDWPGRIDRLRSKAEAGEPLVVELIGGADLRPGLSQAASLADGSVEPDLVIVEPSALTPVEVRAAAAPRPGAPPRFLWLTGDWEQAEPWVGLAGAFDFVFAADLYVALELSREFGPGRVGVAPLAGRVRGGAGSVGGGAGSVGGGAGSVGSDAGSVGSDAGGSGGDSAGSAGDAVQALVEPDPASETRLSDGLLDQLIATGQAATTYSRAIWNFFVQVAGPGRTVTADPADVVREHSMAARLDQMIKQAAGETPDNEPWPQIGRELAQAAASPSDRDRGWQIKPQAWRTGRFSAQGGHLHAWRDQDELVWEGVRGDGPNMSLGLRGSLPLATVAPQGSLQVELSGQGSAEGQVVVTLCDPSGTVLDSRWRTWNARHHVVLPPGATRMRLGVRALGDGTARFTALKLPDHERREALPLRWSGDRVLLISAGYPSAENLYSFGFVHSRVTAFQELGFDVDLMVMHPTGDKRWRQHLGVQVLEGPPGLLHQLLDSGRYGHVGVHFLKPHLWEALSQHVGAAPMTIWVHGGDIQPWWRRSYAIETEADRARHEQHTENLMEMWRQVVAGPNESVRLVFVSETFAAEVTEDLAEFGLGLSADRTAVVNNGVDTELFAYRPKPAEQRLRIAMIRSFATRKYGTDLAAAAIEILSREPFFGELEFLIIGDGAFWEEDTDRLRRFGNVELRRGFATHEQIAELQEEFGVMLQPTRWDSQGVSRDEAMASGLVVISNAVAAVPEFMSEAEGYLAPADDPEAIAQAIRELYHHPEVFAAKSAAAAARVRSRMTMAQVAAQEIALLKEGSCVG
jgi:glycosyltransferase involved in cell wall biosynthesis